MFHLLFCNNCNKYFSSDGGLLNTLESTFLHQNCFEIEDNNNNHKVNIQYKVNKTLWTRSVAIRAPAQSQNRLFTCPKWSGFKKKAQILCDDKICLCCFEWGTVHVT